MRIKWAHVCQQQVNGRLCCRRHCCPFPSENTPHALNTHCTAHEAGAWNPLKPRLSQTSMLPSDSLGFCHAQNGNDICECSISTVLEGFDKKDPVWRHKTIFTYLLILLVLGETWNFQEALLNLHWLYKAKDQPDYAPTSISTACYSEVH